MRFKACDIRSVMELSSLEFSASAAISENRCFQKFHRSTLSGGRLSLSQSEPVASARAALLSSSFFSLISRKMTSAHWIIHSVATHSLQAIKDPFFGGSSSAERSCQIGRLSQGAKVLLVTRAMNEFKFSHFLNSSIDSSLYFSISSSLNCSPTTVTSNQNISRGTKQKKLNAWPNTIPMFPYGHGQSWKILPRAWLLIFENRISTILIARCLKVY